MNRSIIGAALVVAASTMASADTFLVTRGDQLFRYNSSTAALDIFTLSDSFHSLSNTKLGIIGVSNTPENPGNPPLDFEIWRMDNINTVPSLTRIGTSTAQRFPSLTQVGNLLYGVGEGSIFTMDHDFNQTFVADLNPFQAVGGTGYDPISDTFYASSASTDSLYTIDLSDGTVSLIGALGFDFRNQGGEWWRGQYWGAYEDLDNDRLVLGTVNVVTGEFTLHVVLQDGLGSLEHTTVGLAIIPSPSGLALLGLGSLAAVRRRR